MNKQIMLALMIVSLISWASALSVYAGEPINLTLEEEFDYYSIVGNSTPIELDIIQNGLELTITFNKYQQEDTFELIFFNKEKETITVYQSSGGGGSGTKTIYKDRNITQYVDREIEVEKIIEIKDDKELIIPKEEKESNKLKWIIIIGAAIVLALIIWVLVNRKDNFEDVIVQ